MPGPALCAWSGAVVQFSPLGLGPCARSCALGPAMDCLHPLVSSGAWGHVIWPGDSPEMWKLGGILDSIVCRGSIFLTCGTQSNFPQLVLRGKCAYTLCILKQCSLFLRLASKGRLSTKINCWSIWISIASKHRNMFTVSNITEGDPFWMLKYFQVSSQSVQAW